MELRLGDQSKVYVWEVISPVVSSGKRWMMVAAASLHVVVVGEF